MKLQDVDTPDYGQGATNDLPNRGSFELDRRDFLKVLGGRLLICLAGVPLWAVEDLGDTRAFPIDPRFKSVA
jgi:hypothetical protein